MKRFLLKSAIFSIIFGGMVLGLLLLADGYTDQYYIRFTTPKQNSLIIGTSRAAQGLQPRIFKSILHRNIYNYAFTVTHSPFGPTYYHSIQRKLKSNSKKGVFIVTVDPWSISTRKGDPNDSDHFAELSMCLGNTKVVNINPNPFYLINNLNGKYRELFERQHEMLLHEDGWLEINVKMDSSSIRQRTEDRFRIYRTYYMKEYHYSKVRLAYLIKTIQFLKKHGDVYLVRLPVHPIMMEFDHQLMPDFDVKIAEAKKLSTAYLDLTSCNDDFTYTDGNHLYKKSGEKVSSMIANWILQTKAKNEPVLGKN